MNRKQRLTLKSLQRRMERAMGAAVRQATARGRLDDPEYTEPGRRANRLWSQAEKLLDKRA